MHTKETTQGRTFVRPWKRGWLEFTTRSGWMRWWSSLNTIAESIRISGGMIVVTYNLSNTSKEFARLLPAYPTSTSGYRHESDSLLNVFWRDGNPHLVTSQYKLVTHSFASLDDIAVKASPTLQALRRECRLQTGRPV